MNETSLGGDLASTWITKLFVHTEPWCLVKQLRISCLITSFNALSLQCAYTLQNLGLLL